MTNKINGIDVSECGFCCWKHNVNELIENYCAIFNNKCICKPDCYFKQLKRLQEENEELKKKQITKNGFICDCEQNAKYRQALEKTLKILCYGRTFYEGYFDNPNLSRTDEAIKVINEVLNDRN